MKVILLEDIKDVGKKGQLLEASDGYSRNYLLPKGLALEANKKNMNEYEQKQQSTIIKQRNELDAANNLRAEIEKEAINIEVNAGASGKLFGTVTNKEVAVVLEEKRGLTIDRKKIVLKQAIKSVGEYTAEIKLHPKVNAKLQINITESKDE
ncbi:MAG: 50S ribosomal protein L9 [Clostridiales bacterium]|jgi:large subunit ribosomal protein L9|nr:50S ribosomal protein L9 [Clostridiales bacterium]